MLLYGLFSSCGERGLLSSFDVKTTHRSDFISSGVQALGSYLGFGSCGAWAWLLCVMWNLPRPGIKPVSPKLGGGFPTTRTTREVQEEPFDEKNQL